MVSHALANEVIGVFSAAKNLNSAIKNFLKREVQNNESVERFAKDFRAAVASGRPPALAAFIERNYPAQEAFFAAVARYAYPDLFDPTIERIFSSYAEDFNTTYSQAGDSVTVADRPKFISIVKEVEGVIDAAVREQGMNPNPFLLRTFFMGIFEPAVLKEVLATNPS
jgi:hypothetical protein